MPDSFLEQRAIHVNGDVYQKRLHDIVKGAEKGNKTESEAIKEHLPVLLIKSEQQYIGPREVAVYLRSSPNSESLHIVDGLPIDQLAMCKPYALHSGLIDKDTSVQVFCTVRNYAQRANPTLGLHNSVPMQLTGGSVM